MPVDCFSQIMNKIRTCFDLSADAEITLESNPGTLDENKMREFQAAGVNRLSIGVQSLDDKKLKFLGRRHDAATANKLMTFLHFTLYAAAAFPGKEARAVLKRLKEERLYPYDRPAECTLDTAYILSPDSLAGKVFDKVYLNLHRPWGYGVMRVLQRLRGMMK